ncbi:MAG TPA: hypothetical protein VFJ30_04845 [Phycisphaerae bacterium]|nr:hypothetical protein [Phycisphaerae bacterium]
MRLLGGVIGVVTAGVAFGGCCEYRTEPTDCGRCLVDPEEYDNKLGQLYRTQAMLACANQQVFELRQERGQLCAALAAARVRIGRAEYDLAAAEKALAEAREQITSLQKARGDYETVKTELDQAIQDLDQARSVLQAAQAEAAAKAQLAEQLQEQVAALENRVSAQKAQLIELTRRLSEALDAARGRAGPGR